MIIWRMFVGEINTKERCQIMKMPLISFEEVYHVGTMRKEYKRDYTLEGKGLSVSTHPKAWVRINPLTGGSLFNLTKEGNYFLDFHELTKEQGACIISWGITKGYVQKAPIYRVSYYDDEMETQVYMDFDNYKEAKEESGEMDLDVLMGYTPTEKMKIEVGTTSCGINDIGLLSTLYAEHVLEIDGVWWEDRLDVLRYSAPRGVILPYKLDSWCIEKKEEEYSPRL